MRRLVVAAVVVALIACAALAATPAADEQVYFNTRTHKYHCLTCRWAKACTAHCIEISRAEAIKRGGVACKVCGGTCPR